MHLPAPRILIAIAAVIVIAGGGVAAAVLLTGNGAVEEPAEEPVDDTIYDQDEEAAAETPAGEAHVPETRQSGEPNTGQLAQERPAELELVELSDACADTVAPLRDLIDELTSGVQMDADQADVFNSTNAAIDDTCDVDEAASFRQDELNPWLTYATD